MKPVGPGILQAGTELAEGVLRRVAGEGIAVRRILHPSPASPAANRDWAGKAEEALADVL